MAGKPKLEEERLEALPKAFVHPFGPLQHLDDTPLHRVLPRNHASRAPQGLDVGREHRQHVVPPVRDTETGAPVLSPLPGQPLRDDLHRQGGQNLSRGQALDTCQSILIRSPFGAQRATAQGQKPTETPRFQPGHIPP